MVDLANERQWTVYRWYLAIMLLSQQCANDDDDERDRETHCAKNRSTKQSLKMLDPIEMEWWNQFFLMNANGLLIRLHWLGQWHETFFFAATDKTAEQFRILSVKFKYIEINYLNYNLCEHLGWEKMNDGDKKMGKRIFAWPFAELCPCWHTERVAWSNFIYFTLVSHSLTFTHFIWL